MQDVAAGGFLVPLLGLQDLLACCVHFLAKAVDLLVQLHGQSEDLIAFRRWLVPARQHRPDEPAVRARLVLEISVQLLIDSGQLSNQHFLLVVDLCDLLDTLQVGILDLAALRFDFLDVTEGT